MHCGVPVVASDVAGPDEYLRNGKNCLMVPAGNAAELAAATIRMLGDAQLAGRLIEGGRQTAKAFAIDQMAARTLHVYRSLVS